MNGHEADTKTVRAKSKRKVYCTCRQPDDGMPMISCSECDEWYVLSLNRSVFTYRTQVFSRYHFTCVDLSENDAEDISESLHAPARFRHNSPCVSGLYICPSCHQKTGLCTVSKYLRIAHAAPGLVSVFLHFLRPFNVPRKISCRSCRTLSQVPSLRFLCVRSGHIRLVSSE